MHEGWKTSQGIFYGQEWSDSQDLATDTEDEDFPIMDHQTVESVETKENEAYGKHACRYMSLKTCLRNLLTTVTLLH